MNLTTDAWIPIVRRGGQANRVSLCEAFDRGNDILDLAVRPHERVALMRLLICIAQAALDGPVDHEDWKDCRPRIAPSALEYLNRWRHAFELFGNGQRFLQLADLKRPAKNSSLDEDEGSVASKLDFALATGNNTTLFDNAGGSARTFTPPELALMLVTFQCFSPCGTIGVALWNGMPTLGWSSYPKAAPGNSQHAPCISGNMLHSYLRGHALLDSVYLNVVSKEQVERLCGADSWGYPVWERPPLSPADSDSMQNATRSYLGRLAPLSRAIDLLDGSSITLANGLEYPPYPEWREPSATVVIRSRNKEETRVVLPASVERGSWRELHALSVMAAGRNTNGGPLALTNLTDGADFDLWVGGLIAAGNNKLVDATEGVFHVPAEMLHERGQRTYEAGVRLAEQTELRLRRAVSEYHKQLGDKLDRGEMKSRRQQVQSHATAQFWTGIELAVSALLDIVENPEKLGSALAWHGTAWGKAVFSAMRTAFERACPHDTPRKMYAYTLGLRILLGEPSAGAITESGEEVGA